MPGTDNLRKITIESILGGHSPMTHFSAPNQYRNSLGIDPSLPITDVSGTVSGIASGLLRPSAVSAIDNTLLNNAPLWNIANPKDGNYYVYDYQSSLYVRDVSARTFTGISDGGNENNSGTGNGAEYYDNYIYMGRGTTIARYGPLNGAPTLNGDYWMGTLGKSSLTDTTYPAAFPISKRYPNHVMHRHSDGILYIADVNGNQGVLHTISTTKVAVEGDTDNGSTFSKISFGYGLWPTAIESYGSDLVVAFFEGSTSNSRSKLPAKIAFWDTTSTNFNKIVWVEFPDPFISALKNIDGVLYVISGNQTSSDNTGNGFRVSRFVGGYTFREVGYFETGSPCFQGAVTGASKRLLFGTWTNLPTTAACVYSLGLQKSVLSDGLFNIMRSTAPATSSVTCLAVVGGAFGLEIIEAGWTAGTGSGNNGYDSNQLKTYGNVTNVWWSHTFRIGQRFRILKVKMNLGQTVGAGTTITPKIYFDDGTVNSAKTLTVINNTNFPNSDRHITIPVSGVEGTSNFWLALEWSGTSLTVVTLPITIEYELIND